MPVAKEMPRKESTVRQKSDCLDKTEFVQLRRFQTRQHRLPVQQRPSVRRIERAKTSWQKKKLAAIGIATTTTKVRENSGRMFLSEIRLLAAPRKGCANFEGWL
jgi:hypothetical protein